MKPEPETGGERIGKMGMADAIRRHDTADGGGNLFRKKRMLANWGVSVIFFP
jgi:hypothetical protein